MNFPHLKFLSCRIKHGRKSIESGVREHLVEKKTLFKPYFDVGPVQYHDHVEKTFFPTDILGFRAKVFEILGLEADDPDLICKLGIDKGKQWLKVDIIQHIFCVCKNKNRHNNNIYF